MRTFIDIVAHKQLKELFDTTARLKWLKVDNNDEEILARFLLDDFRYYIGFARLDWDGNWEISFALDLDYRRGKKIDSTDPVGVLSTGNATRVFSIVLTAIAEFIRRFSPQSIQFSADEDSRRKLYASMARMLVHRLPQGYRVQRIDSTTWVIEQAS